MPGAVGEQAVRIEGLRELEAAFKQYGRGMENGIKEALAAAAQPVGTEAQTLAVERIRNIGIPWSRMRIGATKRTAYVAPQQRNRSQIGKRPNLAALLKERAMEPALAANVGRVEAEFDEALRDLARMWSRV